MTKTDHNDGCPHASNDRARARKCSNCGACKTWWTIIIFKIKYNSYASGLKCGRGFSVQAIQRRLNCQATTTHRRSNHQLACGPLVQPGNFIHSSKSWLHTVSAGCVHRECGSSLWGLAPALIAASPLLRSIMEYRRARMVSAWSITFDLLGV